MKLTHPRHPVWGIALLAVFALIRLAFASNVDGDEMRDIMVVCTFVLRDFMGWRDNSQAS